MKHLIFVLIVYFLTGCDSRRMTIYSTQGCTENYKSTSLNSIIYSASKYDSSFVEVIGYYQWGFEASAISNSKASKFENSMVWVDFRSSIIDSLEKNKIKSKNVFRDLSGKKIKIRGRVNATGRGHLSQYAATIENICYLEIYNW